ncbi:MULTISPECIES: hypothetical protein [Actinomycetes]|uniref:Uncharacterized protein n=1 Tax=Glycomyces lechevalierae TaxID=256034 RepID=A0ABU2AI25_9ACTN|nr:hypothetical protein [Glycomyces lechevalierae]MDR7336862.1 hypothetical protein [Glycomyces lechevalierae]
MTTNERTNMRRRGLSPVFVQAKPPTPGAFVRSLPPATATRAMEESTDV